MCFVAVKNRINVSILAKAIRKSLRNEMNKETKNQFSAVVNSELSFVFVIRKNAQIYSGRIL